MSETFIHLVKAGYSNDLSGDDITVSAYREKFDAEEFVKACKIHMGKRPAWPRDSGDVAAWAIYDGRMQEWEANHPAGKEDADLDHFYVVPVRLL